MGVARRSSALLSVRLSTLLCSAVLSSASAIVVPLAGWTPVAGNASRWQDASGGCLIREDQYGQAFPQMGKEQDALALANRLRASLTGRGMTEVVTQPVPRPGGWGILAAYGYQSGGVTYRVAQLFVSQSGILRTVSGSSAVNDTSNCAATMRDYIRYQVN